MKPILTAGLVAALFLGLPEAAHACPVCFDANGEVRIAFIVTTGFLSLLPLGMVGVAVLWVRNKHRELDGAEDATPAVSFDE